MPSKSCSLVVSAPCPTSHHPTDDRLQRHLGGPDVRLDDLRLAHPTVTVIIQRRICTAGDRQILLLRTRTHGTTVLTTGGQLDAHDGSR